MTFIIHWNEGDSKGYRDVLLPEFFDRKNEGKSFSHQITHATKAWLTAKFTLRFQSNMVVILDYEGHAKFNKANSIVLGRAKITFDDENRDSIKSFEFRDEGKTEYYKPNIDIYDYIAPDSFDEGDPSVRLHQKRERNSRLRHDKINDSIHQGIAIRCEVCGFNYESHYGSDGRNFCEVHHLIPIKLGAQKTEMRNLALMCANCHRMIHKTKPMQSMDEFRKAYLARNPDRA